MGALQDAAGDNADGVAFVSAGQLDMLRDDKGRLPPDALRIVRQRTGPGRRPGSRNKANAQVAKWFIQKYGDPLDVLGELMMMPPDVLYEQMVLAQGGEAKNKRITGRDVFDLKMRATVDALPYIHGKQPLAVNVTGKADLVMFIPGVNAPEGFTKDQLEGAVERMGIDAIDPSGIRLADGRLIDAAEWTEIGDTIADDDDDDDGDDDDGAEGGGEE